ncbi:hypothetical protein AADZ90_021915 [Aestuariibius sp. 2305UL40-4]|uniref:hypothetical protein n=1 Tax=Aestuariibius violaceus TaxID=3234132 RepID=UPI00345E5751
MKRDPADHPKHPFTLAAGKDQAPLRDKDNAAPRVPPPHLASKPAPNLAPPGMLGIKRNLPQREQDKGQYKTLREAFQVKASGRFTPIVRNDPEKDRGHDR